MGFAEALIKLGIPYNSKNGLEIATKIMSFIKKEGHYASQILGKERGNFPNFKKSIWKNKKNYKYMRNATVTTIAPTGTISIIAGCTSGIEPLFAISFARNIMDGTKLIETNHLFEAIAKKRKFYSKKLLKSVANEGSIQKNTKVPTDVKKIFVTALDISPEWHVRMQSVFQKYTDNAVSKTINLPQTANYNDVKKAFLLAHKLKCKGITVYRYGSKPDQVLTIESRDKKRKRVVADSEFSGGCEGIVCPH
jgi:ribonucleoside-diphosphate reductase alpha chain